MIPYLYDCKCTCSSPGYCQIKPDRDCKNRGIDISLRQIRIILIEEIERFRSAIKVGGVIIMSCRNVIVTAGDPSGIGPEIAIKAISNMEPSERCRLMVVGDLAVLEEVRRRLSVQVRLDKVTDVHNVHVPDHVIPVFDPEVVTDVSDLRVGEVSALAGRAAVAYIKKAVDLCMEGIASGIATTPINKEALRAAGYHYIGHTEMLAEMSGTEKSYTMFMVDRLRILFHSRHLSLADAIRTMKAEEVASSLEVARKCLGSIGEKPGAIALAALNPHASDGGLFGNEEQEILIPAVRMARERGVQAVGPVPADSVFYFALQGKYDAVVSLYHDQGHIASKTYDFYRTVSVTFGLPFIRTSVDHGTAFDIAWKGIANPVSMGEAIKVCMDLAPKYRSFQ
jgi:4-hydroxythreonine-4-phosphate dehydrogenase